MRNGGDRKQNNNFKVKTVLDKGKLRQLIAHRHAVQEMLK